MTKKYLVHSENSTMVLKTFLTILEAEKYIEKLKKQYTTWNFDIFKLVENPKQNVLL